MKQRIMLFLFGFFVLCGCSNSTSLDNNKGSNVFYEIFVRAFADSDGDGIGDFNGITKNLDYLESLGIEGIWLLPVYPSPSYHGYDITDYYDVNSDYGSLEDFKNLVEEAHKRDIKIIMDFVINHTSSLHPWFKSATFSEKRYVRRRAARCFIPPDNWAGYFFSYPDNPNCSK